MKKEGLLEYAGIVIFVALASLVAAGVINKNTSAPETAALALVADDEPDHKEPAHAEPEHAKPEHKEPEHKEPAPAKPEHKEPAPPKPEHKEPDTKPEKPEHKEPAKPESEPAPAAVKKPAADHKEPAKVEPPKAEPKAPAKSAAARFELNEDEFSLSVTGYGPFGEQAIDFFDCTGELEMEPGKPETISFEGAIIMELMDNKHAKLLKSLSAKEFFNVSEHPEAYFSTTNVKKTGDGYEVTGALEIKGIKKKIKYPATITETDTEIRIESEFRVLKSWWDLQYTATALEIKDEALISLDLTFSK